MPNKGIVCTTLNDKRWYLLVKYKYVSADFFSCVSFECKVGRPRCLIHVRVRPIGLCAEEWTSPKMSLRYLWVFSLIYLCSFCQQVCIGGLISVILFHPSVLHVFSNFFCRTLIFFMIGVSPSSDVMISNLTLSFRVTFTQSEFIVRSYIRFKRCNHLIRHINPSPICINVVCRSKMILCIDFSTSHWELGTFS